MNEIETLSLSTYPVSGGKGMSYEDAIIFNDGLSESDDEELDNNDELLFENDD